MEKRLLECLMDNAFIKLFEAVNHKGGRLYIPDRSVNNKVSEQELKYLFIEEFLSCEKCNNFSYSIETPTENDDYQFSNNRTKIKPLKYPSEKGNGRRGNIDVVILNEDIRIALIEFKANNSGWFEHGKDFLKLSNEPDRGGKLLRFFVEIYSKTTFTQINNDITEKVYNNGYYPKAQNTVFIGYSLDHNGTGTYIKFKGDDNLKKITETSFYI